MVSRGQQTQILTTDCVISNGPSLNTLIRCSNFHHINHRMLDVFNCLNAIRVLRSIQPFFFNVVIESIGIYPNTFWFLLLSVYDILHQYL